MSLQVLPRSWSTSTRAEKYPRATRSRNTGAWELHVRSDWLPDLLKEVESIAIYSIARKAICSSFIYKWFLFAWNLNLQAFHENTSTNKHSLFKKKTSTLPPGENQNKLSTSHATKWTRQIKKGTTWKQNRTARKAGESKFNSPLLLQQLPLPSSWIIDRRLFRA